MKMMNHLSKKQKRRLMQRGGAWYDDVGNFFVKTVPDLFINTVDPFLKKTKILSKIAGPLAGLAAGALSLNPAVGGIAGTVATAGLSSAGYGHKRRYTDNNMSGCGKCKF